MNKEQILSQLQVLDLEHRDDGDGGYELVQAFKDFSNSLNNESKELYWKLLLDLITRKDSTLWGVALESITQVNRKDLAENLLNIFEKNISSDLEWKDQIILAILRLAYKPSLESCRSYIEQGLNNNRRNVLPLLAALSRIDAKDCIEISSKYFGEQFTSNDNLKQHRGYIPAFIHNFINIDEHLLSELVDKTTIENFDSGKRLATMFDECLSSSAFINQIGQTKVDRLRKKIKSIVSVSINS